MKALAFSRDRACQLDGMLRSLRKHASEPVDVTVIYTATTERHSYSYHCVPATSEIHTRYNPNDLPKQDTHFWLEHDFEAQVRTWLRDCGDEHVLFLVDDTIFVREWSPSFVETMMHHGHLGFSLRLGSNTTYCYPIGREQHLPTLYINPSIVTWQWPGADGDFGYPLEVSSSVYRTGDIISALGYARFHNPNELEVLLAHSVNKIAPRKGSDYLMAYETSVAFSCPANRVQTQFHNRAGSLDESTPEALLDAFEQGYRLDVDAYAGMVPNGAHQEVPLMLKKIATPYGRVR